MILDTKKSNVDDFVPQVNKKFLTIKLTFGEINKEKLPLLNVLVIINSNKLEFGVFSKKKIDSIRSVNYNR